jgi:hypothetical protein
MMRTLAAGCVIAAAVVPLASNALGRRAETASGDPWAEGAALTDPATGANAQTGEAMAISGDGDTLVVSSRSANGGKGEVLVYTKPAAGWADATEPAAVLTASDGANGDQFGDSVAISGDTIVVGAWGHKVGSNGGQGDAYLYVKPAAGWKDATQSAELRVTDGVTNDHFGYSVGVSGSTVVVGAPDRNVDALAADAGQAYVFVKPALGWGGTQFEDADLVLNNFASDQLLGASVAISGNTIVGGADGYPPHGAAFVFLKPAGGWTGTVSQTATLTASDGGPHDGLGSTVAIDGSTVLAGSPGHLLNSIVNAGAIYVYVKPASGWQDAAQNAELTESDAQTNDDFGESLAMSGPEVVGGSSGTGNMAARTQGSAYVFVEPAAGWSGPLTQTAEFDGPVAGSAKNAFGEGVASDGLTAFVGAPGNEAAYVFDPGTNATITTPADGATYTQGQTLAAAYSCSASAPATLTSCAGPVANGAAVDTGTLGTHTFSVTATASDGVTATTTSTYTVALPTPSLGPLHNAHRRFREGSKLATIARNHGAGLKKPPVGTTFSFTLNTAATLKLTFTKINAKCTKHKHHCKRTSGAGTLNLTGHAGANKITFQGRLSKHHKLGPGTYKLAIVATNATGHSTTRTVKFTIVTP